MRTPIPANPIDAVIEELRKEYETAKGLSWVIDPVCYALYTVWKKYDEERGQRERRVYEKQP